MYLEVRTNGTWQQEEVKGGLGRRLKEYGEIKFERSDSGHLIFHLKRSLIDSGDNNESDVNCTIAAWRWKLLNGIEIVNMISSNTPHIFYSFIFYLLFLA